MDTYTVVVGAVAVHDSHVLLLRRSMKEKFLPGAWGVPAGKAGYGEPLEDAVLRELKEEAGLTGTISKMAGSTWFPSEVDLDDAEVDDFTRMVLRHALSA